MSTSGTARDTATGAGAGIQTTSQPGASRSSRGRPASAAARAAGLPGSTSSYLSSGKRAPELVEQAAEIARHAPGAGRAGPQRAAVDGDVHAADC